MNGSVILVSSSQGDLLQKGKLITKIRVNLNSVDELNEEGYGEAVVKTVIQKLADDTISGGVVLMRNENEAEPVSGSRRQKYIDQEFVPFMYGAFTEGMHHGLIVWTMIKSNIIEEFTVPAILRRGSYELYAIYERGVFIGYKVYRNSAGPRKFENNELVHDKDVWVTTLENWGPSDTGSLQSPVSRALPLLKIYDSLMETYMSNSVNTKNPLLVVETADNTYTRQSGMDTGTSVIQPRDREEARDEELDHLNNRAQEQNDVSVYIGALQRCGMQLMEFDPSAGNSSSDITSCRYVLPVTQKLSTVVNPAPIQEITKMLESILDEIKSSMELPRYYFKPTSVQHAAETVIIMEEFNSKIKKLQKKFSDAFTLIIQHMFRALVRKKKLEEQRRVERNKDVIKKVQMDALYDHMNELISSSSSSEQNQRAKTTTTTVSRTRKYNMELSEDKPWNEVLELKIFFKFSPLTTIENLQELLATYVISQETYSKLSLNIMSLPDTERLKEPEIINELRKRKKYQDIMEPPEEKNKNGNTTTKSSSSSSSSKRKKSKTTTSSSSSSSKNRTATEKLVKDTSSKKN